MINKQVKVVKINLLNENKKYQTSKKAEGKKKEVDEEKQFSFSNDKAKFRSAHTQLPSSKINVSKKEIPPSSQKLKPNKNGIKKGESSKDKINQIRKKVEEYNEHYEAISEKDLLFKKSIQNLKNTMFNDSRDNKKLTIKTLKEIGKYAQNKSKQKDLRKDSPPIKTNTKPKKDIPVQFYGFHFQEKEPSNNNLAQLHKFKVKQKEQQNYSGLSVQQLLKGTYTSFEERYSEELDHIQHPPKPINWQKQNQNHPPMQLHGFSPQIFEKKHHFQDQKVIEEKEIDIICQIFQICEKYEEGDTIVLKDFQRLMEQLERMFFIKVIQQSKADNKIGRQSPVSEEQQFYDSLKQFEKGFKTIFYRREANNIYDTLYYLKQSNKLRQVTNNFVKIKSILPL